MIGERILNIYAPNRLDDWFLLETNKGVYSLRLGGAMREIKIQNKNYKKSVVSVNGKIILNVFTDGFFLIVETEDGDGFKHTPNGGIAETGETYFAVFVLEKDKLSGIISEYQQEGIPLKKVLDFSL